VHVGVAWKKLWVVRAIFVPEEWIGFIY
jgi:hypothetical protein